MLRSLPAALAVSALVAVPASAQERVSIRLDSSQAEAAIAVMDAASEGSGVTPAQWRALETSRPYRRLAQRETSLGGDFSESAFRAFLTSPEQVSRRVALTDALDRWKASDLDAAARNAFAYLPDGARLKGDIYFLIKPRTNSFVWDLAGEPAVFLYLDPLQSTARTQNTIAHELHHVGFGRHCAASPAPSDGVSLLRRWSGAFGEGLAMMAAAGGPVRHPHENSPDGTRAAWDRDVARFAEDLRRQNAFFVRILAGEAGEPAAVNEVMRSYYGEQGPWYTVGWSMARIIEETSGRPAVIEAFCTPGGVFAAYNDAARVRNAGGEDLPVWSDEIVAAMAR